MTMKDVWSVVYSDGFCVVDAVKGWADLPEKLEGAKALLCKYSKGSIPYMDVEFVIRKIEAEIEIRETLTIPDCVSRETFENARYEVERWNIGIDTFYEGKLPALLRAEGVPVHGNEISLSNFLKARQIVEKQGFYKRGMEILNRLKSLGLGVKMDMQSYKLYV